MVFNVSIEIVYGLAVVFFALTVFFTMGRGSSLIVGHNTIQEELYSTKKLCRAMGVCFGVITAFLVVALIWWDSLPAWYSYLFGAVNVVDMLAVFIICHMNIIFKK